MPKLLDTKEPTSLEQHRQKIKSYKDLINSLSLQLTTADGQYHTSQFNYRQFYIDTVVRKFLTLWETELPQDEELFKVIMYIGGAGNGDKAPETITTFDKVQNDIVFKYFNKRLETWVRLEP